MIYKTLLVGLLILACVIYIGVEKNTDVDGRYERFVGHGAIVHMAHIDVSKQSNGNYLVTGIATWVGDPTTGNVNMGELQGVFPLVDNEIRYDLDGCKLLIKFLENSLLVTDNSQRCGGLNVSFNGSYKITS